MPRTKLVHVLKTLVAYLSLHEKEFILLYVAHSRRPRRQEAHGTGSRTVEDCVLGKCHPHTLLLLPRLLPVSSPALSDTRPSPEPPHPSSDSFGLHTVPSVRHAPTPWVLPPTPLP